MTDEPGYRCTACGEAVAADSACQNCGARRRVWVGALQPHPHPKHWGSA